MMYKEFLCVSLIISLSYLQGKTSANNSGNSRLTNINVYSGLERIEDNIKMIDLQNCSTSKYYNPSALHNTKPGRYRFRKGKRFAHEFYKKKHGCRLRSGRRLLRKV